MDNNLFPFQIPIDRSFANAGSMDVSVAILIQYIGSEASALAALVASTSLTLSHGDLSSEAVDSTFGTAGVIDLSSAAFNTCGEVVDAINKSANWRAKLIGALYDDASANLLALSSTQCKVAAGIPIYFDGSDGIFSVAITGHDFKNLGSAPGYDDGSYDDKGCINTLAYITCYGTETGGATLKVLEADDTDTTSTVVTKYSGTFADTTAYTIGDSASGVGSAAYRSAENKRLIVRITCATSLDSLTYFNLRGATFDFRRGRVS